MQLEDFLFLCLLYAQPIALRLTGTHFNKWTLLNLRHRPRILICMHAYNFLHQ